MNTETSLPMTLARLHRSAPVGALFDLEVESDDLVRGAGFERAGPAPAQRRGAGGQIRRLRTLPDWVASGMRVLICGLNPSVVSADVGFGYAGRSNRFWPAALAAGLVSTARDPELALREGVGFTDLVKRASRSAAELFPAEYREGLARVTRLVEWLEPATVVFVGLAGWRVAVDRAAVPGWQSRALGRTPTYVMPSTSGLNARVPASALSDHLRAALTRFG